MKTLLWIAFILGLLFGPGYHLHTQYLSGEVVKRETVFGRPPGQTGDGRLHPSRWLTPFKLSLTPQMNPIALEFAHDSIETGDARGQEYSNSYEVAVKRDDATVYNGIWRLAYRNMRKAMSRQTTSNRLTVLNVNQPGDFEFEMKPIDELGVNVTRLELVIRRNVNELNPVVCGVGYGALLVVILFAWWRVKQGQAY